jgi:uncharacterized protein (DUF1501 family)
MLPTDATTRIGRRNWLLTTGTGAIASLGLPGLNRQAAAAASGKRKSVIAFWLSGGPSHLDMWDPKPDAPQEIRSPFATISTAVPGVQFTEHLPLQGSIANKLSVLRGVDCSASNHTPITFQACNPLARRTDDGKDGAGYPSLGSIAAKFRGANDPDLPAFVGLAPSWAADVWGAGHMGRNYEPAKGLELIGRFGFPQGVTAERLSDRAALQQEFDRLRSDLDRSEVMGRMGDNARRSYEMVASGNVQKAFDVAQESDATRDSYGRNSVGEKALLARRLVEAGVTYVHVSGAWGYFDHHGDSVKWGGIDKGLKPALPNVDRALFALVNDLEQRGLLVDTLVMMLGEFGRSPVINADAGRDHWTPVMSMVLAGGGLRHGQAVGASDARGGTIVGGAVRPQDLAATTLRHLGIDLDSAWINPQGRPIPVVLEGGRPIPELG